MGLVLAVVFKLVAPDTPIVPKKQKTLLFQFLCDTTMVWVAPEDPAFGSTPNMRGTLGATIFILLYGGIWLIFYVFVVIGTVLRRDKYPIQGREPYLLLIMAMVLCITPIIQTSISILGFADKTLPCYLEAASYCVEPILAWGYVVRAARLLFQFKLTQLQKGHKQEQSDDDQQKLKGTPRNRLDSQLFWVRRYKWVQRRAFAWQVAFLIIINFAALAAVAPMGYNITSTTAIGCDGTGYSPARMFQFLQIFIMILLTLPLGYYLAKFNKDGLGVRRELLICGVGFCIVVLIYVVSIFVLKDNKGTKYRVGAILIVTFYWIMLITSYLYPLFLSELARRDKIKPENSVTVKLEKIADIEHFLDKGCAVYLYEYLCKEFAQESLLFVLDVLLFRTMVSPSVFGLADSPSAQSTDTLQLPGAEGKSKEENTALDALELAQAIGRTYLSQDSFSCINVSHRVMSTMIKTLDQLNLGEGANVTGQEVSTKEQLAELRTLFDEAYDECMGMIVGALSRFVRSAEFKEAEKHIRSRKEIHSVTKTGALEVLAHSKFDSKTMSLTTGPIEERLIRNSQTGLDYGGFENPGRLSTGTLSSPGTPMVEHSTVGPGATDAQDTHDLATPTQVDNQDPASPSQVLDKDFLQGGSNIA
eukprot:g70937.t1